ncbi:molybdopterin-synthase adenylyltransferase MoeB [Marinomonas piezotolerans]|uniref:Molybdopterin-synthase adenylyltransferase MoeB n=1 Tax=Marinomonas piezotolerans TaxID=2213058 RepID=A0A370U6N6_9GAMM|nr:HesA/MoeB/ThiF family protein [Marinomonas piezotolerans]RDL43429.1 molybdopterin-synthase adenylyltransferase MoeB [Marinomonas piezotolerans]
MNDDALQRYSRQMLLPNYDVDGQLNLAKKSVVMIGAGGLGNICAAYLSGAGVGHLTIIDDDDLELSNLPRQVMYTEADIGESKVMALKSALQCRNQETLISAVSERINNDNMSDLLRGADVIIDCCDNFATRQRVHRWAQSNQVALVSGAAIRWEGQQINFRYDQNVTPCYECLYPDLSDQQMSCNVSGVMGPVVGVIGVQQALEAIKILAGKGEAAHGILRLFDGLTGDWRTMRLSTDLECPICQVENQ